MYEPKDIVSIDRSGMRTGATAVIVAELVIVAFIFVDTSKVRTLLANALDSRWSPRFRKDKKEETL